MKEILIRVRKESEKHDQRLNVNKINILFSGLNTNICIGRKPVEVVDLYLSCVRISEKIK